MGICLVSWRSVAMPVVVLIAIVVLKLKNNHRRTDGQSLCNDFFSAAVKKSKKGKTIEQYNE